MATDVTEHLARTWSVSLTGRSPKRGRVSLLVITALVALGFVAWLVVNLTAAPSDGSYACRTGGGRPWAADVRNGQLVQVYSVNGEFPHVWTVSSMDTTFGSDAFKVTVNGELTLTCHKAVED